MLISRSANKLKIAGKQKNMDGCNSQPESALFARTNNDYFEQIDRDYSARRRRGDRWLQIKPSNYNNYFFALFCYLLFTYIVYIT